MNNLENRATLFFVLFSCSSFFDICRLFTLVKTQILFLEIVSVIDI